MKKNKLITNDRNLGIQILRFLLCLWVVFVHCSHIKRQHEKIFKKGFHVPGFFMLAFYFFYPILYDRRINKIIQRFQRLLIPYILWPAIVIILNFIFNNIFNIISFNNSFFIQKKIFVNIPIYLYYFLIFTYITNKLLFFLILSSSYKQKFRKFDRIIAFSYYRLFF